MARAVLSAAAVTLALAPLPAGAGELLDRAVPPSEMIGVQFRGGGGGFVGSGADDVTQPVMHLSASIQVRFLEDWYVDLAANGDRPPQAEAAPGTVLLAGESGTAGIRWRPRLAGERGRQRITLGAGGGGGRLFVHQVESWRASVAYLSFGTERELSGDDTNAGTIGVEAVYTQYFPESGAPFSGGAVGVRVTFSYYMGGSYISDCY